MSADYRHPPETIHGSLATICCASAALMLVAATAQYPAHPVTTPEITGADVSARDKAISDDTFQGRGPGTQAGEAAPQWIADEMKRIGLQPGNHGSWFQPVPSVNIALDPAQSSLVVNTSKGAL